MGLRMMFFIATFSLQQTASSQKIVDSITLYNFPVKEGKIYSYEKRYGSCGPSSDIISIFSFSDSVFHFGEGNIIAIFNLGDCYAIVIRNSNDEFITYSNLKTVFVKKRDKVKRGDCIGTILKEDFEERYSLDFLILKGTKSFSSKKLLEYIKCNISTEPANHYTL